MFLISMLNTGVYLETDHSGEGSKVERSLYLAVASGVADSLVCTRRVGVLDLDVCKDLQKFNALSHWKSMPDSLLNVA